jgi:hypothetical protein
VKDRWPILVALVLLAAGAALVFLAASRLWRGTSPLTPSPVPTPVVSPEPSPTPAPTLTEPILPPPPTASASPFPSTPGASSTPELPMASSTPPPATVTGEPPPASASPLPTSQGLLVPRQRLGAGSGSIVVDRGLARRLGLGWYLNWTVRPEAYRSSEVTYMPMIRLQGNQIRPDGEQLRAAARAMPGAVWLIGNEPDVKWQDGVTPEAYATAYHHLYTLLKEEDPSCLVAIGGVSQPTPLRLRYLERILAAYEQAYGQPMPVDVWNVHNFILREERDGWGVDIPPGMAEGGGRLFEISDHDDMAIFRQQIVNFRRWMAAQGLQDKPLIVTEYGILMPPEYGFPAERVKRFMLATFEFFRTAADPDLGYPADGYRLVQRWCWYSVYDSRYPTGNLVQLDDRALTPLGRAFAEYASSLE